MNTTADTMETIRVAWASTPINALLKNMIERTPAYGTDGCWPMSGYHSSSGKYALVWDGDRVISSLRISWTYYFGDPGRHYVRPACGTKNCWNPRHLKSGGKSGDHDQRPPKPIKEKIHKYTPLKVRVIDAPIGYQRRKLVLQVHPERSYEELLYERLNRYRICGLESDDCYEWLGIPNGGGYGILADSRRKAGHSTGAHRLAYEFEVGPIPEGSLILHSCDNRWCTNPRHLRPGTNEENGEDRALHDRTRTKFVPGESHIMKQEYVDHVARGKRHWMAKYPERLEERRGSKNPNATLTEEDVLKIRAEWDGSFTSSQYLAGLYGVSTQAIQKIVHRRNWQHLPPQPGDVSPASERAWARGERITSSILTEDDVRLIRASWDAFPNKYRAKESFCRMMAERYGTKPVAIYKILRGLNWRHVDAVSTGHNYVFLGSMPN